MNAPTIEIENLTKKYASGLPWRRAVLALENVSLRFRAGTCVGVLGPNGSGKSTLMKIIVGLVRPTGGGVTVCGVPAGDPGALERIGYMPERFGVPGYYTPRQTIRVAARLAGAHPSGESRREAERLLAISGLEHSSRRMVARLSRGMRQRLCFAQALAGSPDVLVLDEPFNGVDIEGQREFKDVLVRARAGGAVVLLSTHNHADVEELCDEVVVMVQGTVRARLQTKDLQGTDRHGFSIGVHDSAQLTPPEFPAERSARSFRHVGGGLEQVYLALCRERSRS